MTPVRIPLPSSFLEAPIAHRALHDKDVGRPENSRESVMAAIAKGYAIEVDVQLSSDGQAMVFHDDVLERLTEETGRIQQRRSDALSEISLSGGDSGIPRFTELLQMVDAKVPLLIELKCQWKLGAEFDDQLARSVASALEGYSGDAAVMSFSPISVEAFRAYNKTHAVGLVTEQFSQLGYPKLTQEQRQHLREIADFDRLGCSFISHDIYSLSLESVTRIKARGFPILCWTTRSMRDDLEARKIADNVTFEGYLA